MFQIFNLWRQKPAKHQATPDGYLPYFDDDSFPLKWHQTISKSPSANACVSTIADFLEGFGFSDTDLETKTVNTRGETLFQIHQKTAASFAEFEGFYWHFMYDGSGKVVEWYVLPFECCRLGVPDDKGWISKIFYNPFFGTSDYRGGRNNKDTIKYHAYNPVGLKQQMVDEGDGYHGQVLFVGTTTAQSRFYPYPEAKSAEKWMKIEAEVATYHDDKLENGLHQDYILVMKGNPNESSTNPEYSSDKNNPKTVAQEFEDVMNANFMGAKKAGTVMVQWVNTGNGQETPEVIPIPSEASGDLFINLDNQATKKITVAFKVPAILANINEGVSLGGDGNMLRVAVKLMQQRVIKKQRLMTDAYTKVLKNMATPYLQPVAIVPYNPYPELEVVDDKIWAAMTIEEQRKWIQDHTEIELEVEETVVTPEPLTPEAKFKNAIPVGFPESVLSTIKKALDIEEKRGLNCSTRGCREVALQILNNQSMGLNQMKRIYRYIKKRPELANETWDNCDTIRYNQWGGKEMEKFLESKINDINAWLN